jgi:hypothetical protein
VDLVKSAGFPMLIDHIGKDVSYTPLGAPSRTFKALIAVSEELDSRVVVDGEETVQRAVLGIRDHETTGITNISEGDAFTFNGQVWSVDKWHRVDGAHQVDLVRVVEGNKSNHERIEEDL